MNSWWLKNNAGLHQKALGKACCTPECPHIPLSVTAAVCLELGTGLCIGTQRYLGGALQGLWGTVKGTWRPCGQIRRHLKVLDLHSRSIELKSIPQTSEEKKNISRCPYCTPGGSRLFMRRIQRHSMGCCAGPSAGVYRQLQMAYSKSNDKNLV